MAKEPKPRKKRRAKPETAVAAAPAIAPTATDGPPLERGRPSLFSEAIAAEYCNRMAEFGRTPNDVSSDDDMPSIRTVQRWRLDNADFAGLYDVAHEMLLEFWAYESIQIADDGRNDWVLRQNKDGDNYIAYDRDHVARSALRVKARHWMLAKLHQKYKDKVEHSGKGGGPVIVKIEY